MTNSEEQEFLNNLDKKLWNAADKLRSTLDASQYKHAVLGLIFLKYVFDAFDIRRTASSESPTTPTTWTRRNSVGRGAGIRIGRDL